MNDSVSNTEVTCECGWRGTIDQTIHFCDNGENWAVDQHECPDCRTVIQNNLQN